MKLPTFAYTTITIFFSALIFSHSAIAQNVGVDVATPLEKLDVAGALKIGTTANVPPGGAGTIRWNGTNFEGWDGTQWVQFGGAAGWELTGNTGTVAGTNFIGTIDNVDLRVRTNNNDRLTVLGTGGILNARIGIGTTTVSEVTVGQSGLEIAGNVPQLVLNDLTGGNQDDLKIINGGGVANIQNSTTSTDIMTFGLANYSDNVGIGTTAPSDKLHVVGNIRMADGNQAVGFVPISDANGTMTWTDPSAITGINEIVDADNDTKVQVEETADEDIIRFDVAGTETWKMVGNRLESSNVNNAIYIGENAGSAEGNSSLRRSVFVGESAGQNNVSGNNNVAVGYQSQMDRTSGNMNVAVGSKTLRTNTGSNNTVIGHLAGQNSTTGSGNIFIGHSSGHNETGDNKLYIENSNTSDPLIYGEFDNDIVGINGSLGVGTEAPSEKLAVWNGDFIIGGDQNIVSRGMTIYGARQGTSNPAWNTGGIGHAFIKFDNYDGNSSATQYTGAMISSVNYPASDDGDLRFYTGSDQVITEAMRIDYLGNVGIGDNPADKLHVAGNIRMVDGNQAVGFIPVSDGNGTMTWTDPTTIATADDGDWTISGNDQYSAVSGNVGVGTTTPAAKFEVQSDEMILRRPSLFSGTTFKLIGNRHNGSSNWGGQISSSGIASLDFLNQDGSNGNTEYTSAKIQSVNIGSSNDGDLRFYTNNDLTLAEAMRIDNLGNVGIGGEADEALHVTRNGADAIIKVESPGNSHEARIEFHKFGSFNSAVGYYPGNANLRLRTVSNNDIVFEPNSIEAMRITNTGNVGIGDTSPASLLHLKSTANDNTAGVRFSSGTANAVIHLNSSSDLVLGKLNVPDQLVLNNNGGVGIGTNAPATALHVVPTAAAGPTATFESGSTQYPGAAVKITPSTHATSERASVQIDDWHILQDRSGSGTKDFSVWQESTTSHRLTINTSGNVGIGDQTPDARLDVEGSIQMVDGNQAAGFIPVSDANGTMTWTAPSAISGINELVDDDGDTKVQVEETADDDIIRFDMEGTEFFTMDNGRLNILNTGLSVFVGNEAGANDDLSNNDNVFVGNRAGYSNTTGVNNIAVGGYSLDANTTGGNNTAVGQQSLSYNTTGDSNTATGQSALLFNTDGDYNTANGAFALAFNTTGFQNTATGQLSLRSNTTGNYNTAAGGSSLYSNTTGLENTGIGNRALYSNTTGRGVTAVGYHAGYTNTVNPQTTGDYNTYIGYNSGLGSTTQRTNATAIGYNAKVDADNALVLGGTGTYAVNVGIGTATPADELHVEGSVRMVDGNQAAGFIPVSDANGTMVWTDPTTVTTASVNEIVDADSDTKIQVEETADEDIIRFDMEGTEYFRMSNGKIHVGNTNESVYIGNGAGAAADYVQASEKNNVGIGTLALNDITTGGWNTGLGYGALEKVTTGVNNIGIGPYTMGDNTTGSHNTAIGAGAGDNHATGDENVFLGRSSGTGGAGSGNVLLGAYSGQNQTLNNRLFIENSNSSSPLVYGEFDNDIVGFNGDVAVGHQSPQANLDVAGDANGTADNSMLLRSGNNFTETISNQIMFSWDGGTNYKHALKTRHKNTLDEGNAFDFYVWDQGTDAAGAVGTKRVMTIDGRDQGMVGIGESVPRSELHISDGSPSLKSANDAGGYGASILITDNNIPRIYFEAQGQAADKKLMDISLLGQKLSIGSLTDNAFGWDNQYILAAHRDGRVGIMTGNPQDELHVTGSIRMVDGNQASGFIPVSDANGTMTWTAPSAISGINELVDDDGDTKIQVEESTDEDMIRFDLAGVQKWRMVGDRLESTNGNNSVVIGQDAGSSEATSNLRRSVFVGEKAGQANTTGNNNIAIGYESQWIRATGNQNVSVGSKTLHANTTGSQNVAIGYQAGMNTTGSDNIFIGAQAGQSETGSNRLYIEPSNSAAPLIFGEFDNDIVGVNGSLGVGNQNPETTLHVSANSTTGQLLISPISTSAQDAIAVIRGARNTTTGTFPSRLRFDNYHNNSTTNKSFGSIAGVLTDGTNNLGDLAFFVSADGSAQSEVMRLEKDGEVGIGTTSPAEKLHVVGSIRMVDGNQTVGDILVSDANGTMSWTDPTSASMDLGANAVIFTDTENSNALVELRGSDATYPDEGVTLRTLTNPSSGEPIFRVLSSGGAERLRVEHDGAVAMNNTIRIEGGSPADGKVLTATDGNGNAVWEDRSTYMAYNEQSGTFNHDNSNGWGNVTSTFALDVTSGDILELRGQASVRLTGGSGTDDFDFRVSYTGCSSSSTNLINFRPDEGGSEHDNFTPIPYQDILVSPCTGTLNFTFQIRNTGDDSWQAQDRILVVRKN